MDLQQAYYEHRFEILFLKSKGNTFQEFFEKLMGLAYKTDFMACRPVLLQTELEFSLKYVSGNMPG